MARFAHIDAGRVIGFVALPEALSPADVFHSSVAEAFVPCPDPAVAEGWSYDDARFTAPASPPPDMPALRRAAFTAAMAYGNAITAWVVGAYSDVEARTWPLQRTQADAVLAGHDLPPDALLTKLATRRGVAIEAMATTVQHKAEAFEAIADAGVGLRLGAEGLLSPDLDTPAKLESAQSRLKAEADAAAASLGLTV